MGVGSLDTGTPESMMSLRHGATPFRPCRNVEPSATVALIGLRGAFLALPLALCDSRQLEYLFCVRTDTAGEFSALEDALRLCWGEGTIFGTKLHLYLQ